MKTKTILSLILLIIMSIAYSETIYVVNSQSRTLSMIDTNTDVVNNSFASLGNVPNKIVVDDEYIWSVNSGDNAIQKISRTTGSTVGNIFLGNNVNPWDALINAGYIYATGLFSGRVYKVNLANGTVIASVEVGTSPEALHVLGNKLYVTLSGDYAQDYLGSGVSVIDLDSFEVIKTIPTAANPQYLTDFNGNIHVSCTGNWTTIAGAICIIDGDTDELVHTIHLGGSPGNIHIVNDELALVSDASGEHLYSYHPGTFEILNGSTSPLPYGGSVICGNINILAILKPNWGNNGTVRILSNNLEYIKEYSVALMPTDIKMAPVHTSNEDHIAQAQPVLLYPNPLPKGAKLHFEAEAASAATITIFNIKGQKIMSRQIQGKGSLDFGSELPSGLYFYTLKTAKAKATSGKLVIIN